MKPFDDIPSEPPEQPEQFELPEFLSVVPELTRPPDPIKSEQMRQAQWTFNCTLLLGGVGILILLAGSAALLFGGLQTDKAGLVAASGIITDVLSVFALKFHRETNNRIDEIRRDEQMLKLVGEIGDPTARDQAIASLVKNRTRSVGK